MRTDGKLVTNAMPIYRIFPYITDERNDTMNMIKLTCSYDAVHNYVLKKRKEGIKISHMAVVLAAYVRTVSQHEFLNRFCVNHKMYAHNTLSVAMVVLRPGDKNEGEGKITFDLADTVFDVNDRIEKYIAENAASDSDNSMDKVMKTLLSIPGFVGIAVKILKFMDRHGIMPKGVIEASPMHETAVFTNLASIHTNYIYHHIYNFGTCNAVLAMGKTEEVAKNVGGEIQMVKQIPFGLVMDERIGSGYEFALACSDLTSYLNNPELLEKEPEELKYDFPFPTLSKRFPTEEQVKAQKKQEKLAKKAAGKK